MKKQKSYQKPPTDKQQLVPGNLIYAFVSLPTYDFKRMGKIFAVKEVHGDGSFIAFKLTSNLKQAKYNDSIKLEKDSVNMLNKDSLIRTETEYLFSSSSSYHKLHGKVTPAQMTELILIQENLILSKDIEKVEVSKPLADEEEAARRQIESLYENFEKNPENLIEYLHFKGKFYQYSLRNTLMIYQQNRFATFVTSKSKFADMGYQIKPEQLTQGLTVFKPQIFSFFYRQGEPVSVLKATRLEKDLIEQGQLQVYSKTTYATYMVYDISQTNCPDKDLPTVYRPGYSSMQHKELFNQLKQVCADNDIPVQIKEINSISLQGYYRPEYHDITLNARLNDTDKLNTLCHELGHALLHRHSNAPKEIKELEAQCIANLLQGEFNLEIAEKDISYMCSYMDKAKSLSGFKLETTLKRVVRQVEFVKKQMPLSQSPKLEYTRNSQQSVER